MRREEEVKPKFDKSKVKLIDSIPLRPVGWREFTPKLRVEAVKDFVFEPDESWGPITLVLHLKHKQDREKNKLWAFMNFDVDTAVRIIAAIARACAEAFPPLTTREVLARAMRYAYNRGW